VCDAVLLEDVWSGEVLTHVGGLSLFLEFDLTFSIASAEQAWPDDLPWKCHALYPWSNSREGSHFLFVNMPRHSLPFGPNGMPNSYLVMDKWLPWNPSAFSPSVCDCLVYLYHLVCTQPFGHFMVHVASALNPYSGILSTPSNSFVATQDGREIGMTIVCRHCTTLKIQWFRLLVQLQLHVFYYCWRGDEMECLQVDLTLLLKVRTYTKGMLFMIVELLQLC
jgi:hypothetical protein